MDDGRETREELLGAVEELRRRLAAAEREHQIVVAGLRDESRVADAQWRQRVESLEAKLAEFISGPEQPLSSSQR